MNKPSTTKDEQFLVKLYELALKAGDEKTPINRYTVGKAIGQNDKGINAITVLLAQANFIKKGEEENTFYLTDNGIHLVKQLIPKK